MRTSPTASCCRSSTLALPGGETLLRGVDAKLDARRARAGHRPVGQRQEHACSARSRASGRSAPGRIERPDTAQCLFLPQKPYLPIGSLRGAISYPSAEGAFLDTEVGRALAECRLTHLVERLDEHDHWEQRLSPGEQQRLAFARALLQKPEWLFLDEATSALDARTSATSTSCSPRELPGTTVVSIGHRAAIERFHRRRLAFANGSLVSMPLGEAGA